MTHKLQYCILLVLFLAVCSLFQMLMRLNVGINSNILEETEMLTDSAS